MDECLDVEMPDCELPMDALLEDEDMLPNDRQLQMIIALFFSRLNTCLALIHLQRTRMFQEAFTVLLAMTLFDGRAAGLRLPKTLWAVSRHNGFVQSLWFKYNDKMWKNRTRVSKQSFLYLCEQLRQDRTPCEQLRRDRTPGLEKRYLLNQRFVCLY